MRVVRRSERKTTTTAAHLNAKKNEGEDFYFVFKLENKFSCVFFSFIECDRFNSNT